VQALQRLMLGPAIGTNLPITLLRKNAFVDVVTVPPRALLRPDRRRQPGGRPSEPQILVAGRPRSASREQS
jgi:hypothetical protein